MNEAREIRLRLLEMVGREGFYPETIIETALNLERFVLGARIAKPVEPADSSAPTADGNGPA